jgi:hypothetical protein
MFIIFLFAAKLSFGQYDNTIIAAEGPEKKGCQHAHTASCLGNGPTQEIGVEREME